jgi:alkaline phosphatase D
MTPKPAFFAHLGDFGYAQDTDSAALAIRQDCFHDRWTRMLSRSQTSALHEHTAWLMQQDDHDYGQNNTFRTSGFPGFTIPAWDDISGNDYESTDHRYFDIAYGDVHGFVLNTRQYADDPTAPDGPDKSLLGNGQKQWLKDSMRAAANGSAKMLVVFATTPFWGAGAGETTWKKAYARERSELIDFFFSLQDGGTRVLMCTGNSHAQYVNRFRNSNPTGKDLYEFVSSGTDRAMPGASGDGTPILPGPADDVIDATRARKNADGFGFISYDPTGGGTVSLRAIRSDTGRDIWAPLVLAI